MLEVGTVSGLDLKISATPWVCIVRVACRHMSETIKIKIGRPLWLEEMFSTGRLQRTFNPSSKVLSIKSGECVDKTTTRHFVSKEKQTRKAHKFSKKIGKMLYQFDSEKGEIVEYIK